VTEPPLYYYRDRDAYEIDILIFQDGAVHPIEIKKTANPDKTDIRSFARLDGIPGVKRGNGGIICLYDRLAALKGEDMIIPVSYL
jgi:predicted AAA+ superfamily ATPase